MRSWRRFRVWLPLGIAAVVALLVGRHMTRTADRVNVARVRTGPLESWITTNGVIEPRDPRVIRARVATFVKAVHTVEGQWVKKDDLLLTLDTAQQRADLARAREDLAKAENDLRLNETGGPAGEQAQVESDLQKAEAETGHLRKERDALARLVEKQAATRAELDQAELALARAEVTRHALRDKQQHLRQATTMDAQLRRLAIERSRETVRLFEAEAQSGEVRAPVDGTVYSFPVRAGSRVEIGAVLADVADLDALQLRAFVDEPELASVQRDQIVQISWSALPGRVWNGRTERVPKAVVSRGDRLVGEVLCSVDHPEKQLIPNLDVDVRIRVQSRPRALLVPRAAVRSDASGRFVFTVQDHVVHRRTIVVDGASATNYAIVSGVSEGEWVALPGTVELRDGMRVDVGSEAS